MNVNNFYRQVLVIIFLFLIFTPLWAQEFEVKNVRFEDKGETVVVKYDLNGIINKKYKITLSLYEDNGNTFKTRPRTVSGDVGKNVRSGLAKEIIWHLKGDYPEGLFGDGFVFAVEAELQKGRSKLKYILAGTVGIIGGVVYFITKSSKEKTTVPTTGSIVITIPNEF